MANGESERSQRLLGKLVEWYHGRIERAETEGRTSKAARLRNEISQCRESVAAALTGDDALAVPQSDEAEHGGGSGGGAPGALGGANHPLGPGGSAVKPQKKSRTDPGDSDNEEVPEASSPVRMADLPARFP